MSESDLKCPKVINSLMTNFLNNNIVNVSCSKYSYVITYNNRMNHVLQKAIILTGTCLEIF